MQLPLLGELGVQGVQIPNQLLTRLIESVFGGKCAIGLDAKVEFGEERMWDLVGGEDDARIAMELVFKKIAESVVFFVEVEERAVGDAC